MLRNFDQKARHPANYFAGFGKERRQLQCYWQIHSPPLQVKSDAFPERCERKPRHLKVLLGKIEGDDGYIHVRVSPAAGRRGLSRRIPSRPYP